MKSFLNKYYTIKEVKAHNDYLLNSLQPQIDYNKKIADEILALKKLYISSSEKLEDYVKDSSKWILLKTAQIVYQEAQKRLQELKHKTEQVLYESYPHYITIEKHTYVGTAFYTNYDDYDNNESNSYEKTYTFFTTMVSGGEIRIIDHFKDYLIDYKRKENSFSIVDLIDELIESNENLNKVIMCYDYEKRLYLRIRLSNLFNVNEMSFWTNYYSKHFIKYKEKNYLDEEVITLSEQYFEMKQKKYIKDDKYVDYPDYIPFVDFLELINKKEYQIILEDS